MKLNKIDKKLLSYMYHHYRDPLTKISKACKISRDQVEYRLKKYQKENIIKRHFTVFNYKTLNYNKFIGIFLKLKDTSFKEEIISELKKIKNTIELGEIITKYDLFVNFVFKDESEFNEIFYSFLSRFKNKISYHDCFIITKSLLFPLKIFDEKKQEVYGIVSDKKHIKLTEKDYKFLKILEMNSRMKLTELSKKTNMSPELISYKLKQFKKNNIILGSCIEFNMKKLGFYFTILRLKLYDLTNTNMNKIISFCKNHKHINSLLFGISDYNCMVQFFYKDEEELRNSIQEFNNNFSRDVEKSDLILINKEELIRTLP